MLCKEIARDELPLIEYHAVKVEDKCKIGLLLQILPNIPSEANHLKRIKNGLILIQPANGPLLQVIFFIGGYKSSQHSYYIRNIVFIHIRNICLH